MSIRNILLIVGALFMIGGTAFVAKNWLDAQRAPAQVSAEAPILPEPELTYVLIAKVDIPVGTFLQETDLEWQAWPDDGISESYLIKDDFDETTLFGSVARQPIVGGDPMVLGRVVAPGERGFLAAVLKPGFRAVSIEVNETSGIGGFVFPGDRVDLILSHTIQDSTLEDRNERRASETILTNVRILAVDQVTNNDSESEPTVADTATLELTPKQAEMIAAVRGLGQLSLSLRSLAKDEEELERLVNGEDPMSEPEPESGKTYTWESDVSVLVPRPGANDLKVVIARGSQVEELDIEVVGAQ
ncbi:Flp pilus assembly protein CpaB [Pelagibius sp. Alg239-R121]|uniref:Flp pilus assembly protein CpaB n=1 Tax=Pelagibius sp. Alg239-R121 TaxID=2993448 RepID=UPI0024A7657C|nr:Flp pilus assembly protein CpaB [Pelagibius sp. Alg239-R121]